MAWRALLTVVDWGPYRFAVILQAPQTPHSRDAGSRGLSVLPLGCVLKVRCRWPLTVLMTRWIAHVTLSTFSVTLPLIRGLLSSRRRRQLFFSLILGKELLQVSFPGGLEKMSYLDRPKGSL